MRIAGILRLRGFPCCRVCNSGRARAVGDNAVAPFLFGSIERGVGLLVQSAGICRCRERRADAAAEARAERHCNGLPFPVFDNLKVHHSAEK